MQWMTAHWPTVAQIGGGVLALAGVALLFGVAVALVAGGVLLAAAGTLREAKLI